MKARKCCAFLEFSQTLAFRNPLFVATSSFVPCLNYITVQSRCKGGDYDYGKMSLSNTWKGHIAGKRKKDHHGAIKEPSVA